MNKKISLKIDETLSGKKIKNILLDFSVGRGKIEELRVNKAIFVNDNLVDLDYIVNLGDTIVFNSNEAEVEKIEKPIKVLYEDDDFIAVYKNKGDLVHSDGTGKSSLINYVSAHVKDSIIYPVNRIDVDTSGIVLFAKNFLSSCAINKMVEKHELTKIYLAKVKGKLKSKKGKLEFVLGRDRHDAKKMIVKNSKEGLKAISFYEVLEENEKESLVKVKLITGRKHQIRVSFSYIGHPILGDILYGDKQSKIPLQLEASYLSFISPITKKIIEIKTEEYALH